MLYGYYLEGRSNSIFIRHYIEGYKTIRGLEKARKRYCERFKVALVGQCLFSFTGNTDRRYHKSQYKTLEQFNCKPFFEYWPQ
jgi:hypothetical protein